MPLRPRMMAPVGKSGPWTIAARPARSRSGSSIRATVASMISPRLCGGMLVAMPTAMPPAPLTSRFGYCAGQDGGLVAALVVVRPEVDRVLVDVGQQRVGDLGEPGFGVAHRRRRIAVHRAEIALPVDQRQAHAEVLRHADQGVVDRGIAVRVVLAHHVADDQRRLAVRPAEIVAGVAHGVEDAPLHRLEAVAHVGQRAADDHAHGVIEVAALHLLLDRDDLEGARRRRAGQGGKSRQVKGLAGSLRRVLWRAKASRGGGRLQVQRGFSTGTRAPTSARRSCYQGSRWPLTSQYSPVAVAGNEASSRNRASAASSAVMSASALAIRVLIRPGWTQ